MSIPSDEIDVQSSAFKNKRTQPKSWGDAISKVPEHFREPLIDLAWKVHDETLKRLGASPGAASPVNINTAETTAMTEISAAVFMPLHLIKPSEMPMAEKSLRSGIGEFFKWIKSEYPTADTVIVIGDSPQKEAFFDTLDEIFEEHPAKRILCSSGTGVEKLLNEFGPPRNYGVPQICGLGDRKEIFSYNPGRLIAFEPVQTSACNAMIEASARAGIPIIRIDAPTLEATSRMSPR